MWPIALLLAATAAPAENEYLAFVRAQAAALRANDLPPANRHAWATTSLFTLANLIGAWDNFPKEPAPLAPQSHGTLTRDGYTVEKITFQTFPGVRMTANLYRPATTGKRPAILMVHGHWKGAKQDPVVQSRCIGAVKLGFVVLCVDAFGAGERGIDTKLGEYHGAMTAATLLPVGTPLSGLQVYENQRAVDYLRSLPEVAGEKIGITGASGGGNQTMYAAAWDDRLKAAVPVCSVGNYPSYLGQACCLCEVVPGALRFADEWHLLGMTAPRAVMVVSATKDAPQFSVGEAKKSIAAAGPVFKLYAAEDRLTHAVFESGHDYSKPMREAMYGWMTKHLKREGDGSPIPEPEMKTEDPETLRCFPGTTRPADWVTVPRFAAMRGRGLVAAAKWPADPDERRKALLEVLGGYPASPRGSKQADGVVEFSPEPGITLKAHVPAGDGPLVIILDLEGREKTAKVADAVRAAGGRPVTLDLRATGALSWAADRVHDCPDHNTAEWGLWIGRPLIGQWVCDVRRLLDRIGPARIIGVGPAGLVAVAAAALDRRIPAVSTVGTLDSFVTDKPYVGQRLGTMIPGVLRHVGDVPQIAVLATKVVVAADMESAAAAVVR